jgi:glutamate-1-semialdehyde 2,1-aminomutase
LTTLAKILAGGLPGGCVTGRADVLAALEFRPGKPKMKHPGTFNANPLSAAAGTTTLGLVSNGEPCRKATAMGRLLRRKLNELFDALGASWVAYGEFSDWKLLPDYQGARPADDSFVPYDGVLDQIEKPKDRRLIHTFRRGMLLHGVDLPGLGGMTMMVHTEADVERTVAAVAATLEILAEEGLG